MINLNLEDLVTVVYVAYTVTQTYKPDKIIGVSDTYEKAYIMTEKRGPYGTHGMIIPTKAIVLNDDVFLLRGDNPYKLNKHMERYSEEELKSLSAFRGIKLENGIGSTL